MAQLAEERNETAAGSTRIRIDSSSATASSVTTMIPSGQRIAPAGAARTVESIESAVYAHLQAMRALGHTRVSTGEVAKALGLAQSLVDGTIAALQKKGVKVT